MSTGRKNRYAYYRCSKAACLAVKVKRQRLEDEFADYLEQLTPRRQYLALFREIVRDAWRERHAESAEARRRLEARLTELRDRKTSSTRLFCIDASSTYERQRDKLAEETTLAEMAVNEARLDEFDVEGVLAFAEHLLTNVARMWTEASLDQKQRLQSVLFPSGVTYGADGFGTAETSLIFSMLDAIAVPKHGEVSPPGFELVLPT